MSEANEPSIDLPLDFPLAPLLISATRFDHGSMVMRDFLPTVCHIIQSSNSDRQSLTS